MKTLHTMRKATAKFFIPLLLILVSGSILMIAKWNRSTPQLSQCAIDNLDCIRKTISKTIMTTGIDEAVRQTHDYVNRQSADCHNLMHIIGEETRTLTYKDANISITGDLQDCSFGFWHGFMTVYAQKNQNDLSDIIEYCRYHEDQSISDACFHGLGIGLVGETPPHHLWGNIEAFITHADSICPSLYLDTNELYQCATGAYHQAFIYSLTGEFATSAPDTTSLFDMCIHESIQNKEACLFEMSSDLPEIRDISFEEMISNIEHLDQDFRQSVYIPIMSVYTQTSPDKWINILSSCMDQDDPIVTTCIEGVISGIMVKFPPEEAKQRLNNLCEDYSFSPQEHNTCTDYLDTRIN